MTIMNQVFRHSVTTDRSTDNTESITSVSDLMDAFENEQIIGLVGTADPDDTAPSQYLNITRKQNVFLFSSGRYPSGDTLEIRLPNGTAFELVVKQTAWVDGDDDA